MGELKKYDGGIMFSDNDVCDVESLKVRFTPIQSGTGTPSPTNVMPISGYNRFNVKHTGKNVCRLDGWGARNTENYETPSASNSYGTTVSNTDVSASVIITQSQAPITDNPSSYQNGYFVIVSNSLEFDTLYNVSFDVTNITNNILNASISDFKLVAPNGSVNRVISIGNNRIKFIYEHSKSSSYQNSKINEIEVRNCGISCTISNVLITKIVDDNYDYEEYNGEEFIVNSPIGKNLADIYGVSAQNFTSIYSASNLTNSYGTSIVVSENNNKVVITQSQAPDTSNPTHYQNGYISFGVVGLTFGKRYKVSFRITDILNNPLNVSLSNIIIYSPSGSGGYTTVYDTDRVMITITYGMYQNKPYRNYFEIRNCGMSCTISDFMVTEADVEDQTYEPYKKTMYGGYIDFVKGEYVQEWAMKKITNEYTYIWYEDYKQGYIQNILSDNPAEYYGNGVTYYGDCLKSVANNKRQNNIGNFISLTASGNGVGMSVPDVNTLEEFNTWIANNPVTFVYKLATPIHHPLAPLQLQTYAGINNIWCEANGEADIWRRNSKPISTEVEKSVIGDTYGIANFTTKSALPLEKCKVGFEFSQDLNGYSKPWAGGAGKNLYDAEKYPLTDGRWISGYDGVGNSTSNPYAATLNFIPCSHLQGKTLTLNKRPSGQNPGIAFYTSNDETTFISGSRNLDGEAGTPMTFEVPTTANYMRFTVPAGATEIQIEIGDTATSYEPYANVCPINGTSEFNVVHTGKNMAHVVGYSASSIDAPYKVKSLTNTYGTTINTTNFEGDDGAVIITQSQAPNTTNKASYRNGYLEIVPDNLEFGKMYKMSFKITNITSNPLDATLSDIRIRNPYGNDSTVSRIVDNNKLIIYMNYMQSTDLYPQRTDISLYNCGMSFTLSEFMATPVDDEDVTYEPYRCETIPVKLPALGKNKIHILGYSAKDTQTPQDTYATTNNHGTTINTTEFSAPDTSVVITQSQAPNTTIYNSYENGYVCIQPDNLVFEKNYIVSFKVSDIVGNPLNATLSNLRIASPSGRGFSSPSVSGSRVSFTNFQYTQSSTYPNRTTITIYNCGMSCTISEFMVTEASETDTTFEPFNNTVYSGYLDMSSGELTLDWIGATKRLSDANTIHDYGNIIRYDFNKIFSQYVPNNANTQYCSIAPYQWALQEKVENHFYVYASTGNEGVRMLLLLLPTADKNTKFDIVCKLQSPITYQLTPQQIKAFRGMNNIYQTASNSIEIDYKDMNHNELDLIGLRRNILLNAPHMETINS